MPSLFPLPGPSLPSFKTLLVKGSYHSSAPIHLSLSCTSEAVDSYAILISPSRQDLTVALRQYNDEWLKLNSGLGKVSSLSSRVKLLLLSTLTSAFMPAAFHTTLASPPSLLILHEPSAYFLSSDGITSSKWTLSSYLSLITHALSSLTFLARAGQTAASFALFDSRLDQLRLPMVKQPTYRGDDDDDNRAAPRLEPVFNFAQKYFEWIIVADEEVPSVHETRKKKIMVLHRNGPNGGSVKTWEWSEGHDIGNLDAWPATRLFWPS
ncbi:hypothetical protein LshimejAT787_0104880 [Lyophyllum shimeji]|uniref:Uncharacterized protein n=1 Tax=Lyophyllum shimeji TaxID=47721 RepID=A0A9P3PDG3_LYOSH|nr:hypothetical protein LshimejAT787_0104880 [Lyophyllum shimeji]